MKKPTWILYICCIFILNSCREDININETTIITPEPEINVISNMKGVVVDENDNPVTSALVTIRTESTFTNNKGEYTFTEIIANQGKEQITVSKEGYFTKAAKIHNQSDAASYNKVVLLSQNQTMIVNTNQGTAFPIQGGASMDFLSNSLRNPDGTLYQGEARIYARFLNPNSSDFPRQMMSELVGINTDGNQKALKPLAMLHLDIKSTTGETLEINQEVGIELEFPLPPDEQGLTQTIPSWIYDLEEEFWLQDVDCYPVSGNNYSCTIYSTGAWTCCQPVEGIGISLDVINSDLTPASFVKVEFEDYNSYFHFGSYTNNNGQIQGTIPINEDGFRLTVQDLCANIAYEDANAGPYTVDTNLPDILLDVIVEEFSINVQGTLLDCGGAEVNEGWVNVRYPDYEKNFELNPDSSFDFDVYFNCISFPDMEITAYDINGEQASNSVFHNQLSDVETGMLTACETLTSSLEITGNGNTVKMFPVLYSTIWSEPTDVFIQSELPGGEFYIRVNDYDGLGFHSGDAMIVNNAGVLPDLGNLVGEGQTLSVEIISDDGEYMEGNIIGTINNNSSNFNIDVSFRARKKL